MIMILNKIFWCIFVMFIWFNTSAFIMYFPKNKFVRLYKDYQLLNPDITFPNYLVLKHPNFLTKLISCQPCFLFWVLLIITFIFGFSNFPIIYIISYFLYRILIKYS